MKEVRILNAKGEPVVLTQEEQFYADNTQRELNAKFHNALGAEVSVTTLTQIVKKVSEQKFYEIPFADYLPVRVGQGAWSTNLTTYRSFDAADEFETGVINTGTNNARLASADAAVDTVTVQVNNWAKTVSWNIIELRQAMLAGNWDLITAKEEARLRNFQLGIQRIAFLGARGMNGTNGRCLGLLNQPGVAFNSTVITQPINSMSVTQLKAFTGAIIEAYRSNCVRSAWPTHFIIPESDYNGLANQASADFPIKSTLAVLEDVFKTITRNSNFKILPLAYGDKAYSGLPTQMYTLLNYDEKSVRMDIPVDYTATVQNTINGFQFSNTAYSQFTGVLAYRPLEVLYFGF